MAHLAMTAASSRVRIGEKSPTQTTCQYPTQSRSCSIKGSAELHATHKFQTVQDRVGRDTDIGTTVIAARIHTHTHVHTHTHTHTHTRTHTHTHTHTHARTHTHTHTQTHTRKHTYTHAQRLERCKSCCNPLNRSSISKVA